HPANGLQPAIGAGEIVHLPELVNPDQGGAPIARPAQNQYRRTEDVLDLLPGHSDRNLGRAGFEVLAMGEEEDGHGSQEEEDNQRNGDEQTAASQEWHRSIVG